MLFKPKQYDLSTIFLYFIFCVRLVLFKKFYLKKSSFILKNFFYILHLKIFVMRNLKYEYDYNKIPRKR